MTVRQPSANPIRAVAGRMARLLSEPALKNALIVFLVFRIALLLWMWLVRLPKLYSVYYDPLLFLVRMSGMQPLLGTARYVLALIPAFIILAQFGKQGAANRVILYGSWACQMFMAGQFAIWGWVG